MEVLFHVPRWNRSRWQIRQHAALGARVPSRTLVLLSHHVYIIRYDQNIYLCNNCNFLGSHPSPHQLQHHQQQTTGVYLPYFLQTLSTDSRSQSLMPAVWHISLFFYLCHSIFSTAPGMMVAPVLTFLLALICVMPWSVSPEGTAPVYMEWSNSRFLVFTA